MGLNSGRAEGVKRRACFCKLQEEDGAVREGYEVVASTEDWEGMLHE